MSSEWAAANGGSIAWTAIYGLTAVSLAVAAFQVGFGSRPRAAKFWATFLTGLGVLPALDFGETAAGVVHADGKLLVQAACLLIALTLARILTGWAKTPAVDWLRAARLRAALALALLGMPTVFWSARHVYSRPDGAVDDLLVFDSSLCIPEKLRETNSAELWTDRGTRIAAYWLVEEGGDRKTLLNMLKQKAPACAEAAIPVGPPEPSSNCHGWVFAEGQAIIRSESIDCILAENDYRPVESPEPGDLVVYRDSDGAIVHTGVVKATGRGGFALVESKWGLYGSYLHESRQQSYSDIFAFYRSPRRGHRLRGRLAPLRATLSMFLSDRARAG